jgi:tetratricopeptide (TPR) repeat protein
MRFPTSGLRPGLRHRAVIQLILLPLVLTLGWASCLRSQAQVSGPVPPPRRFTIEGRITLPDGSPAANVRVKLSGEFGVNFELTADDAGRYSFPEVPSGNYRLEAHSVNDALASDVVLTDTSRTATNSIIVNFSLHANQRTEKTNKASVISAVDAGQQVPKKARKAFEEGIKFKKNNEPDKALASFSQAVEAYPDYYQALVERGDLQLNKRQFTTAAADYERALKSNDRYPSALRGAGYCKMVGGKLADAIQFFDKAVAAEPDSAWGFLLLGMANFELDRREQARLALQQAVKIDANQAARAHLYLANLYVREQHYLQAADELHAYLEIIPSDPNAVELRKTEADWRANPKHP